MTDICKSFINAIKCWRDIQVTTALVWINSGWKKSLKWIVLNAAFAKILQEIQSNARFAKVYLAKNAEKKGKLQIQTVLRIAL